MTNEAQYTYEPVVSGSGPLFDALYCIYEDSLPVTERKPKTRILASVSDPEYNALVLKRNDVVIGFSILFTPVNESFCLLEYMAIHVDYRSLGLGGELFLRTFSGYVSDHGQVVGLLEVDSVRDQSSDQDVIVKRQKFYRRLGCLCISGLSYTMPSVGNGTPPPMDILVYHPKRFPLIHKQQLKGWLEIIYSKVYDCASSDPRIEKMIKPVDDPIQLI